MSALRGRTWPWVADMAWTPVLGVVAWVGIPCMDIHLGPSW